MAARLVTSIEVWEHDRSARIAVPGVSPTTYDVFQYMEKPIEIHEVVDQVWKLTAAFVKGSDPVTASPVYLSRRRVLRVHYDDATFEEYRIVQFERELSGQASPKVVAHVLWEDLFKQPARKTRTGGRVDLGWTILKRTPADALAEIMADAPAPFVAGSTTGFTKDVSLVSIGESHGQLIQELCAQLQCEWEAVYNAGNYEINLVAELGGAGTRPVEFGKGSDNNRRTLKKIENGLEYFSRVVPLGGPDQELLSIAEALWSVSGASYAAGPNETTLTLDDDPIWVDDMPGTTGIEFGNATQGYFVVKSSTVPDQVVVTGDASALNTKSGKFRLTTADDLTYLADPAAEASAGTVEKVDRLPDVQPFNNLLADLGVSEDLSDWSAGLPVGTQKVGAPTVTQESTDDRYIESGTSSAKVEADTDEGLETIAITLPAADYMSLWAAIRITAGSVRLELDASDGRSYPLDEEANGIGDLFRGLAIGGIQPPAGAANLKITALEDSTVFYLDSWTVTASVVPYAYTEDMGPEALWQRSGLLLAEEGGIQPDQYEGVWFDKSYLDGASEDEAVIGGKHQIKDAESGGTFAIDFETRLVELKRKYHGESYEKIGKFGARAKDVTDFLTDNNRRKRSLQEVGSVVPPPPATVDPPSGFSAISGAGNVLDTQDGQKVPRVLLSWVTSPDAYLSHYQLRAKNHSDSEWAAVPNASGDATKQFVWPVKNKQLYSFEIRAVNTYGLASSWILAQDTISTTELPASGGVYIDLDDKTLRVKRKAGFNHGSMRVKVQDTEPSEAQTRAAAATTSASFTAHTFTGNDWKWVGVFLYSDASGNDNEGDHFTFRIKYEVAPIIGVDFQLQQDPTDALKMVVSVEDLALSVTAIEFNKRKEDGTRDGWASTWDASTGTLGVATTLSRTESVDVAPGKNSEIGRRVTWTDADGVSQVSEDWGEGTHMEAQTKLIRLAHTLLQEGDQTQTYGRGADHLNPGVTGSDEFFRAAFTVPKGVTLTKIEAELYRNAVGDKATVQLFSVDPSSHNAGSVGSLLTHSTTGWQSLSTTLSELVADKTYVIDVTLKATSSNADARFMLAEITYTVPSTINTY